MLSINISEVIWTIINFFLMLFLLNRFLYKPVLHFMDERRSRMENSLNAENAARQELNEYNEQLTAAINDKNMEAKQLMLNTKEQDIKRREEALTAARRDAAEIRRDEKAKVEQQHEQAEQELKAHVPELSELLADKLLKAGKTEH